MYNEKESEAALLTVVSSVSTRTAWRVLVGAGIDYVCRE
jgi:hypothetical protein